MGIRDLLIEVAKTCKRSGKVTKDDPGHQLLKAAGDRLQGSLPYGMVAKGHGGQGVVPVTPWIGVHDSSAGKSGESGLYIAYILAADRSTVTMTLQQGITEIHKQLNESKGERLYTYLRLRTQAFRQILPPQLLRGLTEAPNFRDPNRNWRPLSYSAASIAAMTYDLDNLPSEVDLCADLGFMVSLLKLATEASVYIQENFAAPGPTISLAADYVHSPEQKPEDRGLNGFCPKDSGAYTVHISAQQQLRKRDHERLIADFGPHAKERGFTPITDKAHPRDIILKRDSQEWVVEAKVVREGNTTLASREALSQLFEYRHFYYQEEGYPAPHLLGLFTEEIGAYEPYLEHHGIASVWQTADGWRGSDRAAAWGIAARG
ncbi:MrcB family domain-containing protein [Streptomyces xiamenensis]|uniref:MrcB family domain-containing protein n=1 Tax=Streptomyces xiamenensis TaxID=408015 RepID=UPI0037D53C68